MYVLAHLGVTHKAEQRHFGERGVEPLLGCVSEEVEPIRDVSVDRLLIALIAVVFKTDAGVVQSNHGTAMAGQVTALSFHTIADGVKQLREVLARSGHLMGLRNKAQHRLDGIVDSRDTYRVERLGLLRLVLCKIRLVSNEAQPLDVFPLQFYVSPLPYGHTTQQRECQDRSENPLEARKQAVLTLGRAFNTVLWVHVLNPLSTSEISPRFSTAEHHRGPNTAPARERT